MSNKSIVMPSTKLENSSTSHQEKPYVILILQGGGALGAYQAGVYKAMISAGLEPDWVAGISIGALNSCIIGGNKPEDRLARLEEFWGEIATDGDWSAKYMPAGMQDLYLQSVISKSAIFGIPPLFKPQNQYLNFNQQSSTSYYNPKPMFDTLEKYASFEKINTGTTRISAGASKVCTGELVFFDNTKHPMKPEHFVASASLPPLFPAQSIDNELYWDGGCVSNTPLEVVIHELPQKKTLVFLVDLWNAYGEKPKNMSDVLNRLHHITYADKSIRDIQNAVFQRNLAQYVRSTLASNDKSSDIETYLHDRLPTINHNLDIIHLVYSHNDEIEQCAFDFTHASINRRKKAGYDDAKLAINEAPWAHEDSSGRVAAFYEIREGQLITEEWYRDQRRFAFFGE